MTACLAAEQKECGMHSGIYGYDFLTNELRRMEELCTHWKGGRLHL